MGFSRVTAGKLETLMEVGLSSPLCMIEDAKNTGLASGNSILDKNMRLSCAP